jgi:hypothetical protein
MMDGYKKIYTFGDGFASNHIWPEWPAILEALLPNYDFQHFGAVGAGNEFILNAAVQANISDSAAYFVVQWAYLTRFDKLIEDSSWDNIIDNDPVYSFNRVPLGQQLWWLSSASKQVDVVRYHQQYVQPQQSQTRILNAVYLLGKLLSNRALFFPVGVDLKKLKQSNPEYFAGINLVEQDLYHYSYQKRFAEIRQYQVQPSPMVHLCYLKEHVLPVLPFEVDPQRLQELEQRINQHNWQPYDPDRDEIWHKITDF